MHDLYLSKYRVKYWNLILRNNRRKTIYVDKYINTIIEYIIYVRLDNIYV